MQYEDKMKKLPSGIYKAYLLNRIFRSYSFEQPILEIGCGTGEFLDFLKNNKLTQGDLVEMNKDTIAHCREKCALLSLDMNVHNTSIFDLDLGKQYKSIFMFEVLEHIENDLNAIKKVFSILSDDGLFLISVPAKQSLFSNEDIFQGHLRRYQKKDLIEKMKAANFTVEFIWCYNPLPYITKYFTKRKKAPEVLTENVVQKTKDSSHNYYPTTKKLVDIFYPIYSRLQFLFKFQNIFLNTDFGAHYLLLAKKT